MGSPQVVSLEIKKNKKREAMHYTQNIASYY